MRAASWLATAKPQGHQGAYGRAGRREETDSAPYLGRSPAEDRCGAQAGLACQRAGQGRETCRRLMIPVRHYLAALLPGLAATSVHRLAELTPAAWAVRNR
jgi:hypothetical protein